MLISLFILYSIIWALIALMLHETARLRMITWPEATRLLFWALLWPVFAWAMLPLFIDLLWVKSQGRKS